MVVVSLSMVVVVNMMEAGPLYGGGEHELVVNDGGG